MGPIWENKIKWMKKGVQFELSHMVFCRAMQHDEYFRRSEAAAGRRTTRGRGNRHRFLFFFLDFFC